MSDRKSESQRNRERVAELLRRLYPDRDTFTLDEMYEAYEILWPRGDIQPEVHE